MCHHGYHRCQGDHDDDSQDPGPPHAGYLAALPGRTQCPVHAGAQRAMRVDVSPWMRGFGIATSIVPTRVSMSRCRHPLRELTRIRPGHTPYSAPHRVSLRRHLRPNEGRQQLGRQIRRRGPQLPAQKLGRLNYLGFAAIARSLLHTVRGPQKDHAADAPTATSSRALRHEQAFRDAPEPMNSCQPQGQHGVGFGHALSGRSLNAPAPLAWCPQWDRSATASLASAIGRQLVPLCPVGGSTTVDFRVRMWRGPLPRWIQRAATNPGVVAELCQVERSCH